MKKEDKIKKAVALKYDRGKDMAPKVMAKGRGTVADKILALARENRIPIEQDSTLMEALYRLDINEEIPEELYKVVALSRINPDAAYSRFPTG
jgi:flagellar biosynthesis protein